MKRQLRTYRDLSGNDRSGLAAQVEAQRARVRTRLASVERVVAVASGKGGVGKSYVTAGLALGAAARLRGGVGVLDADLNGPTTARLLGARGPVRTHGDGVDPATGRGGVKVFSTDLLLADGQPLEWRQPSHERFVWRSTLEAGALREFLSDVSWGSLDLLLIDLAPGSAQLVDLGELLPALTGAVAITIPSEESRRSVARAIRVAKSSGIRLLGVVENMSGYACDQCGTDRPLFGGDAGADLAAEFESPLLGRIPFQPVPVGITRCAAGQASVATPDLPSEVVHAFLEVIA